MRSARTCLATASLFVLLAALGPCGNPPAREERLAKVVAAAVAQVGVTIHYAPAYQRLPYPGGDLPADRGVCTDVVIRAFRAAGVDLQKEVHEDMAAHFGEYPKAWGLSHPDSNIDHRRCPNLVTFLRRRGALRPVSDRSRDYEPGDLVFWRLTSGVPHVGLVTDRPGPEGRPLVVHNIGLGAQLEDVLFAWPITAHARYF